MADNTEPDRFAANTELRLPSTLDARELGAVMPPDGRENVRPPEGTDLPVAIRLDERPADWTEGRLNDGTEGRTEVGNEGRLND